MEAALVTVAGLVLRVGLPVLVMAGLFYFLGRRFGVQDLAFRLPENFARLAAEPVPKELRPIRHLSCWELSRCDEGEREKCAAFHHPEMPCWLAIQTQYGELKKECLSCRLLVQAA